MAPITSPLWRNFRVFQVFGSNTNVGKTIFSTVLCRAASSRDRKESVFYLKPVSTGPSDHSDKWHLDRFTRDVVTQSIYEFDAPVSPHLAADTHISDQTLLKKIADRIKGNAEGGPGFMLVETAGGPNSPGPSGSLQADLYRPLRIPTIFVADWRLGGISTSISGFESLKMRGYDVEGIAVLKDSYYKNYEYFQSYFRDHGIPILAVPKPPEYSADHDHTTMKEYYQTLDTASENGAGISDTANFTKTLYDRHDSRIANLESLSNQAHQRIWYPFTQHQSLTPASITSIESAQGDYFQVFRGAESEASKPETNLLQPTVDGSASWWTQGLGHANPALTMSAAYAAGRYGHVMFASAIHEPAINLADTLIDTLKNPRLSRVFYSDNGSTGTEVAIKMALKASAARYGWNSSSQTIEVIGLKGSYHGDTMGSMDMSEPSLFNSKVQWYNGKGFWFDVPTVKMREGKWVVDTPESEEEDALDVKAHFYSLQAVFDPSRDSSDEAATYKNHIRSTLEDLTQNQGRHFGALVLEPVVLGAGGMQLVDPLFQRMLIQTIRKSADILGPAQQTSTKASELAWSGLPVIADEVFTGLSRLGHASPSMSLLHAAPDISVHAKLLTGGLVPLAATCASESIFEAFLAEGKEEALLHGHSYTAHAVGCAVAGTSLRLLKEADDKGTWNAFKEDWGATSSNSNVASHEAVEGQVWSTWSLGFVEALSNATSKIDSVWALGSVLAIELRDTSGASGYASNAAKGLQHGLLHGADSGVEEWAIHSRVLGNVLYLMTSQTTTVDDVRAWETKVQETLGIS